MTGGLERDKMASWSGMDVQDTHRNKLESYPYILFINTTSRKAKQRRHDVAPILYLKSTSVAMSPLLDTPGCVGAPANQPSTLRGTRPRPEPGASVHGTNDRRWRIPRPASVSTLVWPDSQSCHHRPAILDLMGLCVCLRRHQQGLASPT